MEKTAIYTTALENVLTHFSGNDTTTPAQLASIEKIIVLFKEEACDGDLPSATKSRRSAARRLLRTILQTLGDEVFFLCVFAFPITRLGTTKEQSQFIGILQGWWSTAKNRKTSLSVIIPSLVLQFPSTSTVKFSTAREHQSKEAQTGVCPRVDELGNPATATDPDSDSEGREAVALDSLGAPMTGNVYQVDVMDAIRLLVNSQAKPILTIPHYQGVQPFLTIRVPEKLATQLMMGQKQLM